MATFYVSKTGNDSNNGLSEGTAVLTIGAAEALVDAAVGMGAATNTISIGDGTYTETVTYAGNNCTFISTSQDRTAVIITQSNGSPFRLAMLGTTSCRAPDITLGRSVLFGRYGTSGTVLTWVGVSNPSWTNCWKLLSSGTCDTRSRTARGPGSRAHPRECKPNRTLPRLGIWRSFSRRCGRTRWPAGCCSRLQTTRDSTPKADTRGR